jgi:hypothetical protein
MCAACRYLGRRDKDAVTFMAARHRINIDRHGSWCVKTGGMEN